MRESSLVVSVPVVKLPSPARTFLSVIDRKCNLILPHATQQCKLDRDRWDVLALC